jgi:hypothetical protein
MSDAFNLAKQEADAQLAVVSEWSALIKDFEIQNDEQQEQVAGVLRDVKKRSSQLEERRKEITVPLNKALNSVNDLFRHPRAKFDALEKTLKEKIATYLRKKSEENSRMLREAAAAPTAAIATRAIAQVAPVLPPQGVSVRQVTKFEVVNADLVPRELCSPDLDKIKLALSTGREVPGVRVYQEAQVTARRG